MAEQRRLDQFSKSTSPTATEKASNYTRKTRPNGKRKLRENRLATVRKEILERDDPAQLSPSYLVSGSYDGKKGAVSIKLYEPKSKRMYLWHDTSGHKPYLLTSLSRFELDQLPKVKTHVGFDHFEEVEKFDPLLNTTVKLTKVVAKDPLAIGGRPKGCLREIIPEEHERVAGPEHPEAKVWEASITYYQNYIYDHGLVPGMMYSVANGKLVSAKVKAMSKGLQKNRLFFSDETSQEKEYAELWIRMLEYPAPPFRRVALDIEVLSPVAARVPDPREARDKVICASFVTTDGADRVLLLKREDVEDGSRDTLLNLAPDTKVEFFEREKDLVAAIFEVLWDYPFAVTFNGDDFDLRYLAHRGLNLGFSGSEIPIEVGRRVCSLKRSVHIDLYKFFYNRSIQVYAFNNKYREVTLDSVGKALISLSKIELEKPFAELSYSELALYCLRDAQIAFELTSFNDDLTMKLILVLARISKMPMENVSRQGVSRWIRNFLHWEHRRQGMLIPNTSDILALKGKTATTAIIKGKKYKGAIVVAPVPGVHFDVAVMDFPSLYPSIIKVWNLGYQTILCSHEECKKNVIPDTPHWVCSEDKALESLLIGSLRDLRVRWYKPRAKDRTLPQAVRNWYNVVQSALKVILNASYGVFGAESFDLYCPPVAEATAAIGRDSITKIVNKAKQLAIEVLYGDTDSVFLKNPSESQISELAKWSERELKMGLDVDKRYRYVVFSSRKKNYLGVLEDGTVDVKGLTGKKKHIPRFIKDAFEEMKAILGKVKSSSEFEEAKKNIKRIVLDRYNRLKKREWTSLAELAFHVVLGEAPEHYKKTTPQHVVAARLLQDEKNEIKAGDRVSFVKVKPRVMPIGKDKDERNVNVMPLQLAIDSEIDVEKYVAYLQSTFDQVLDALGLEFDEIIGLTKLERFM